MTRLSEAALPCTLYLIIRVYFKAANVACASLGPSSLQLPLSLFFELTFLSGLVSLLMFHSLFFFIHSWSFFRLNYYCSQQVSSILCILPNLTMIHLPISLVPFCHPMISVTYLSHCVTFYVATLCMLKAIYLKKKKKKFKKIVFSSPIDYFVFLNLHFVSPVYKIQTKNTRTSKYF